MGYNIKTILDVDCETSAVEEEQGAEEETEEG